MEFINPNVIKMGFIPPKFESQRIPIAQAFTYSRGDVTVFSQVIDLPNYEIHFHIFDAENDAIIRPHSPKILALHYMLHGNIECVLRQSSKIKLVQDEYNMFVVPGRRHHAILRKGIYECFHINLKPNLQRHLEEELFMFDFFHKNLLNYGGTINLRPYPIGGDESLIITRILTCEKVGQEGIDILDYWASELVLKFAEKYSSEMNALFRKKQISDKHLANIYAMREFYSKNLSSTHDLEKIADLYKMTAEEIETSFEDIFGWPFTVYFGNQRMSRAFSLLAIRHLEPATIATVLGYKSRAELEIKFEEYFGKTIAEVSRLLFM
ncbi:helix-turn-helix transcriptional regulator [Chitinophaga polysaccharea]|uniref:helix-turn-helix transcriptional regulator n=1 Tax=Chitinophaga polysaccharea TaxID=1293035 RepID=UPI001455C246|nr:helix-turn-helix transcriptional regulator [Chitinophaga polysaccharea]NLR60704.1 helix-turn-helix transcriptional regulator [Chitinophaga polysaccharea]